MRVGPTWYNWVLVTVCSGIYPGGVRAGGLAAEGDKTRASISGAVVGTVGLRGPRTVSTLRQG